MKLHSRKKKLLPIIIIAVVAILIIAAIVAVVILTNPGGVTGKNEIQKIVISVLPEREYFVGENFAPAGLKIQVITGDVENPYFVEYPNSDLKITGFDSSTANEALPITVTYKGVSTTFNVKIKEYPQTVSLVSIRLSDNFYSTPYTVDEWNTYGPIFDGVKLILTYSDGTEKEVPMRSKYCSNVEKIVSAAGTTQFIVTYPDELNAEGNPVRCTVTVTITE